MVDQTIMRMTVLEVFEVVQRLLTVEHLDVLRLSRRELPDCPRQVNEVRLHRIVHRVHSDLTRQAVRLSCIARAARGNDIGPLVGAAA